MSTTNNDWSTRTWSEKEMKWTSGDTYVSYSTQEEHLGNTEVACDAPSPTKVRSYSGKITEEMLADMGDIVAELKKDVTSDIAQKVLKDIGKKVSYNDPGMLRAACEPVPIPCDPCEQVVCEPQAITIPYGGSSGGSSGMRQTNSAAYESPTEYQQNKYWNPPVGRPGPKKVKKEMPFKEFTPEECAVFI